MHLASGLVLFTYVTLHLTDHALLNVSIDVAQAVLGAMKTVWQSLPGAIVLYSAMSVHLLLAFWALYERRHFQWRANEAVQLTMGFCIPVLLANHILATRVSLSLYHTEKGYPIELWSFWISNIQFGLMQHAALLVAWIHGCLGVYFWLRLKRWFRRLSPVLLAVAVLIPVLALLGSFQGGRVVRDRMSDPAWVKAELSPDDTGSPAQNGGLVQARLMIWEVFGAAVLLVLAARGVRTMAERRRGLIRISYVDGRTIQLPRGMSVLDGSRLHRIPHTSVCGGRGRCTTCRIRVFAQQGTLPTPTATEAATLTRVGAEPHVRLACQLRHTADLTVALMVTSRANKRGRVMRGGEERALTLMFVDMRGSTQLAERRMPFDTVFVVNSFLAAVGQAVSEAGGETNQVLGDGLMSLFGLHVDPVTAAGQALTAASGIARNVAALDQRLAGDLQQPLRYGIGINGGDVIIGDVGYEDFMIFTALGDPVNVAARLESMTKEFDCTLLVMDEVYRMAGRDAAEWPLHKVLPRGREAPLQVRSATEAVLLASSGHASTLVPVVEPQPV